ncbi:MAG TPA: N-formylglutamate amidohydrolase [Burkholderiaceae bacterium]|nr:N-formylglutamate amidohydrolase [Burkholderiaceae bacterium]
MQDTDPLVIHGPRWPERPLVLDSPHSGRLRPPGFDTVLDDSALRTAEDSFVDELYLPATQRGIPLLAARWSRVYLDVNRLADDIDPDLLDAPWPGGATASSKARLGKALLWRTLDDGRAVYARRLAPAEVTQRIERCHAPYHRTLRGLLDAAHQRFGHVVHINCHSMNAVAGAQGEGGAGSARADFVLGDRDGTTCDPALTGFVRATLAAMGYEVRINDPFKGVALVQAYSAPSRGRHSLQIEINKRLYMDEATQQRHAGFDSLQRDLMRLLDAVIERAAGLPDGRA